MKILNIAFAALMLIEIFVIFRTKYLVNHLGLSNRTLTANISLAWFLFGSLFALGMVRFILL